MSRVDPAFVLLSNRRLAGTKPWLSHDHFSPSIRIRFLFHFRVKVCSLINSPVQFSLDFGHFAQATETLRLGVI